MAAEMDANGCDMAHEARMLEEYGEEVLYAGWNPQLKREGESPVVPCDEHANGQWDNTVPDVAPPSASEEVIESIAADIPQCP